MPLGHAAIDDNSSNFANSKENCPFRSPAAMVLTKALVGKDSAVLRCEAPKQKWSRSRKDVSKVSSSDISAHGCCRETPCSSCSTRSGTLSFPCKSALPLRGVSLFIRREAPSFRPMRFFCHQLPDPISPHTGVGLECELDCHACATFCDWLMCKDSLSKLLVRHRSRRPPAEL